MGTNYISLHRIVLDMGRKRDAKYYQDKLALLEARESIEKARSEYKKLKDKLKK